MDYLTLESGECSYSLGLGGHFYETEASGLSAIAVLDDGHRLNFPEGFELTP